MSRVRGLKTGMDFRSGLKTGVENGMFWSEIASGFGEPGGTPPPRIQRSTPRDSAILFENFLTILQSICIFTRYMCILKRKCYNRQKNNNIQPEQEKQHSYIKKSV